MALPARSVPAAAFLEQLRRCGVTFVVSVPDTHQKSLLAALEQVDDIKAITCCTEDEAITVAAGMWIGGAVCALMIQHAGLYACVNHLRGVGLDMQMPLFLMIGLLGRELDKTPRENRGSMVRLAEPLLDVLGIPYYLVDGPEDVHLIHEAFDESRRREMPVAALIGAPTA
jgi:sulfopyruvate decarboxylase TPP-binding subunit